MVVCQFDPRPFPFLVMVHGHSFLSLNNSAAVLVCYGYCYCCCCRCRMQTLSIRETHRDKSERVVLYFKLETNFLSVEAWSYTWTFPQLLKTGSSSNDGGGGTADPFLTALAVHARPALYIPLHLSLIFCFYYTLAQDLLFLLHSRDDNDDAREAASVSLSLACRSAPSHLTRRLEPAAHLRTVYVYTYTLRLILSPGNTFNGDPGNGWRMRIERVAMIIIFCVTPIVDLSYFAFYYTHSTWMFIVAPRSSSSSASSTPYNTPLYSAGALSLYARRRGPWYLASKSIHLYSRHLYLKRDQFNKDNSFLNEVLRLILAEHATSSRHRRIEEEKLRGNETLISYTYTRAHTYQRENEQRRRRQDVQVLMQKFAKINQGREHGSIGGEYENIFSAEKKKIQEFNPTAAASSCTRLQCDLARQSRNDPYTILAPSVPRAGAAAAAVTAASALSIQFPYSSLIPHDSLSIYIYIHLRRGKSAKRITTLRLAVQFNELARKGCWPWRIANMLLAALCAHRSLCVSHSDA
ncbi:unnamed protein product [Trichogramma brassicae]|uniref:Uncharacterized protein n=1 Tax=Trichogramma brassicae TaxID=86971 RepID=A0A6H5J6J8_9HYME|nr:unnamed protein product [Trichogramma brassicae]